MFIDCTNYPAELPSSHSPEVSTENGIQAAEPEEAAPEGSGKPLKQVAALPFRVGADGRIEILLITSRDTGRWIIPEGLADDRPQGPPGRRAGGLRRGRAEGEIAADPVGWYRYDKRLDRGRALPCKVRVYPLRVEAQHERWPEREQRTLRWFRPEEAARLVHEDELQRLLAVFAAPPLDGRA